MNDVEGIDDPKNYLHKTVEKTGDEKEEEEPSIYLPPKVDVRPES